MEQPVIRTVAPAAVDLGFYRFITRLSEVPRVQRIGARQNAEWTTLWVILDATDRAAEDRLRDIEDDYLDHASGDRFHTMHVAPLDQIDEGMLPPLDSLYERK